MVVAEPTLMGIKKIGHDLDKAIARGFKDIFNVSSSLWCTQHIKGRDENQLRMLGCRNPNDISRILADIYGTQNQVLLQDGLADAENEEDFDVKLNSLQGLWDEIVPGFHDYFRDNHRELFIQCLVMSAREELGIEDRFYTNGLELKHR